MVDSGRGYGHKQISARCLTILKIINALSKTPYTYEQLWQVSKIQRNTLRKTLDSLISKEMVTRSKEYSLQNEGNGRKKEYYQLNLGHPIITAALNKEESNANIIEQISYFFFKSNGRSIGHLYDNILVADVREEPNLPIIKKSLVQPPPKDESPNAISKQYEYLIEDIKYFVDQFIKHYYPPEEQRPYYARAVWLIRQLFRQYSDNRYHRDLYDWSEIYLAAKGLHPSGKSAKEISAGYGEKTRRYDKRTGEPIYGRKGISKRHIQTKSKDTAEFLQEFHLLIPLFMFMHKLFKNKKEKLIVDHIIDRK